MSLKPPQIQINQGALTVVDGRELKDFLINWQREKNVPDGTLVYLIPAADLEIVYDELKRGSE